MKSSYVLFAAMCTRARLPLSSALSAVPLLRSLWSRPAI